MNALLQNLNPAQFEACTHLDGALLILAGAGTGKTRVLTTRLAHLIASGKARPHEILAVTFTNKAASEMKTRIQKLLHESLGAEQLYVGTFHALSARFLRQYCEEVGLTSRFTILDPDDQLRLMRSILQNSGIEETKQTARHLLYQIESWKNKAWLPDQIPPMDKTQLETNILDNFYELYQERLRDLNAVDFDDLLLHMVMIWKNNSEIIAKFHARFKYILVDEYQDTNVAQYLWLRLLAQKHRNLCCVGDDDQAIYSWRGAEIKNILRFEKDYPEAKIIRLETNYRSTGHILNLASGLINHNQGRMGKALYSNDQMGEKIQLCQLFSGEQEAKHVTAIIESLELKKTPLSEIAILVRTGAQTRIFEEALLHAGFPYQIIGGMRFYEREEIRDIVAYLRLIAQNQDDLALERIINKPARSIGATSLQLLKQQARQRKIPIFTLLQNHLDTISELKTRTRNACQAFVELVESWRQSAQEDDLPTLTRKIIEQSQYQAALDKNPDKMKRDAKSENLRELLIAQSNLADLESFLEHISLVMDNASSTSESVLLMTIHAAKGLEFENVFLPGWEDGLFPSMRTIEESGQSGLEEERRLAYVALTRAKKRVFILHASGRRIYGQWQMSSPSRFLQELPRDSLELTHNY